MKQSVFLRAGAAAGVAVVALLLAASASAKPTINVPCAGGQTGLVAAINAANSAGGGTVSLARGCEYDLTAEIGRAHV